MERYGTVRYGTVRKERKKRTNESILLIACIVLIGNRIASCRFASRFDLSRRCSRVWSLFSDMHPHPIPVLLLRSNPYDICHWSDNRYITLPPASTQRRGWFSKQRNDEFRDDSTRQDKTRLDKISRNPILACLPSATNHSIRFESIRHLHCWFSLLILLS